jgi:hypothetical protein
VKTTLEVKPDPRVAIPTSALESQYAFAKRVSDAIGRLVGTVNAMRSVREQLAARVKALASDPKSASWITEANKVQEKTLSLERELHNPEAQVEYDILAKGSKLLSRLNLVFASARYGDGEPTQGMREVYDHLSHAFDEVDARWQAFVSTDLAKLDAAAAKAGQGAVVVPANQ